MIFPKTEKPFGALGLGEVMLRLSPPRHETITRSEMFEKSAGGSELNVVSGLSMLGVRTGIITKLPRGEIGKFIKYKIRYSGASDDYVTYDTSPTARLGIYYYEGGAYPRLPSVSYDRKSSSFTGFKKEELPLEVYSMASVFHTGGITLALGEEIRKNTIEIMRLFKEAGAIISFDVNYRAALWGEAEARETILGVLPLVDILFISEETARRMFGLSGTLYEIQKSLAEKHCNLEIILSTKRKVISPVKHSFSSLVYDCKEKKYFEEDAYRGIDVIDRIGSGDAYVAGALFGLLRYGDIQKMAEYGDAMAALKNTVRGDMPECDLSDIDRIIKSHHEKGPKSEMIR